MMNSVLLSGRATSEPKMTWETANGHVRGQFTLAVNREGPHGGTDFIPIVAWDDRAREMAEHVRKGTRVNVAGDLRIHPFDGRDGVRRTFPYVQSTELLFPTLEAHKALANAAPAL